MATIDHTYVSAAVEGRLGDGLDGSDVAFVRSGDPEPDGESAWCRLVAVDVMPEGRNRSTGNDTARVNVAVNVAVGAGQQNAHAIANALAVVGRVLDEWTDDDSATTGHLIELDRAETRRDPEPFENPEIRTGSVIATGRVQRPTGVAFLDVLT